MIDWNKRARRENTQLADRRTWRSRCGHYKVEEHTIRFGNKTDKRGNFLGYPTYYLAMRLVDPEHETWDIITRHHRRSSAVAQCEYFHEHGHQKPPNTKANKHKRKMKKKRKMKQ